MNKQKQLPFDVFAIALAMTLLGASNVPGLSAPNDAATIFNPGNGDYTGFRIVVEPGGHAEAVDAAGRASNELRSSLVDRFFKDLSAAPPSERSSCASATPVTSADVNAAISVAWKHRRWSDLRCTGDARSAQLSDDAAAIARALYVQAYRARAMYVYAGNRAGYAAPTGQTTYAVGGLYPNASAIGGGPFTSFGAGAYGSSPYTGYPAGTLPSGSLPSGSITGSLPTATLPLSSPYTGLPSASVPSSNPYGSSPYSGSPYGGF